MADKKVTLATIQKRKQSGTLITMVTAYDYPSARIADASDIDIVLVGDSLGMVVHGFENTLPVTLDMMIMHSAAARRGVERAYLVTDLPFGSYQISAEQARTSAIKLMREGMPDAIKMEGGRPEMADAIRSIVDMGIAVMGHVGLTPQSVSALGGFKVQGKTIDVARKIIADAAALQEAGCFSIVLEAVPDRLARLISESLDIPTIGIGAGVDCDGQVLVLHDMLGLYGDFAPKFSKRYVEVGDNMKDALNAYAAEVRGRTFPAAEHSFTLSDEVYETLLAEKKAR